MRTTLFDVGICPPCHVAGFDHAPLCADRTAARVVSREKSGMLSGSVVAAAGAAPMAAMITSSEAIELSR